MKKAKKEIYSSLIEVAKKLPFNYTEVVEKKSFLGADILKTNPKATDSEGKVISSDKNYVVPVTKRYPVDHFKRMKRIYRSKGLPGVQEYVNGVMGIEIHAATAKSIGGIMLEY